MNPELLIVWPVFSWCSRPLWILQCSPTLLQHSPGSVLCLTVHFYIFSHQLLNEAYEGSWTRYWYMSIAEYYEYSLHSIFFKSYLFLTWVSVQTLVPDHSGSVRHLWSNIQLRNGETFSCLCIYFSVFLLCRWITWTVDACCWSWLTLWRYVFTKASSDWFNK